MNFILKKYISWHERNFPPMMGLLPTNGQKFSEELLLALDKWLVNDQVAYPQFMIGYKADEKGMIEQTGRLYIQPELRQHPYIKASRLPQHTDLWYFEWDAYGGTCFLGTKKETPSGTLLKWCKTKNATAFIPSGKEVLTTDITSTWPNPFPFVKEEIRVLDQQGNVKSIFYLNSNNHPSRIPRPLDRIINLHIIEAYYAVDKYAIDSNGDFIVYFP